MKKKLLCCLMLTFVLLVSAAHAAPPFTTGLQLHYEADALNLYNGDAVLTWQDSDPQFDNPDLVTEAPFLAPKFVENALNGHAAVKFVAASTADPNTQSMLTTALDVLDNSGTNGICIFVVATGGTSLEQRMFQVGKTRGGSLDARGLCCDLSSNVGGSRFNNGSALVKNPFEQGQWIISIHEIAQGANPSASFFAVNSTSKLTFTSTDNQAVFNIDNNDNEAIIGSVMDKNGNWRPGYNGMVAEVLVYNNTLVAANKQLVYDYLYNKYAMPGAHDPIPAQGSKGQGTLNGSTYDVNLSWTTGTTANITKHYLYYSVNDPNLANVAPIELPLGTTSYALTGLTQDSTVFWRVDESVLDSAATSPDTLKGWVWQFKTVASVLTISQQPVQTSAFPGGTAQFSITASSISPVSYAWWYSADSTIDANDVDLGATTDTLTRTGTQVSPEWEGYYYCKVTNATGTPVVSSTAKLGVKRKVAHWTLDNDAQGWDGTKYIDKSGEGHHADPNGTPTFAAGVNATTNQSVNFDDHWKSCATTGVAENLWAPAFGTGETTISLWFKLNRVTGFWQGVVTSRGTEGNNFLVEILPSGKIQLNTQGYYGESACVAPVPLNEWTHVALVMNSTDDKIYLNGELVKVFPLANHAPVPQYETQFTIGCLGWTTKPSDWLFPGNLDDIQIYNYSLTQQEIIDDIYYPVSATTVCLKADLGDQLKFDFAGGGVNGDEPDCQINLKDFAALAASWLNCAYYPYDGCE